MGIRNNQKPYIYKIGLYLSIAYVLFGFVASEELFPFALKHIALYGLLGYSAFVVVIELIRGRFIIPAFPVYYFIVILICYITSLYSYRIELISSTLYSMIVCFLQTLAMCIFIRTQKDFILFCWGNVIASIIIALLLFVTGKLYGTRLVRLGDDISGNANVFAMGMMYPCMLAIWLIIYGRYKNMIRFILFLAILIDMYAITLSGGRKSFVLPFAFLYILLVYKKNNQNRKQIIKYTLITIILILLSVELIRKVPVLHESIGIRIEQMLNGITGKGTIDSSSQVRSEFRKLAIDGWLESPIWGHGFDSFKYYAGAKYGYYVYSHCNQTELLFCGGLILFLAYYGVYVHLYNKANSSYLPNEYAAFVKAALISEFIFDFGLVSFNVFFVQRFIMLAYIASGFSNYMEPNPDKLLKVSKYIIGDAK